MIFKDIISGIKELTTTTNTATKATTLLNGALKLIKTHPVIAIASALTIVVTGIRHVHDALTTTTEEAEEAYSEFKNVEIELESLNKELKEQDDALQSLLNKSGELTYTEKGELERLQQVTAELRIQQDILEKKKAVAQRESATTAVKAYNDEYGHQNVDDNIIRQNLNNVDSNSIHAFMLDQSNNDLNSVITAYIYFNNQLDSINKKLANTKDLSDAQITSLQEEALSTQQIISTFEDDFVSMLDDLTSQQASMFNEYQELNAKLAEGKTLTLEENEIISIYKTISNLIKGIYSYYDSNTWNNMAFDKIFSTKGLEVTKDELIELAQNGELTNLELAKFPNLCEAINNSDIVPEDGQTKAQAFCEEINALSDGLETVQEIAQNANFADIFALEDAGGKLNALGKLNEQLDNIQSAYSALKDAMDTYSKTGYITIDQFQAIVEQGSKFLDYLELEEGALSLDEQAMYDLAEARIIEMKAQMVQGIIDNVSQIDEEAEADLYLASTNYELADSYHQLAEAQLTAWAISESSRSLSAKTREEVLAKAREDIAKIEALTANINLGSLGGNSGASDTKTAYADLLEAETTLLEKQLEARLISFDDYVDKRKDLIERYYRDGLISAEDYYAALEDMYDYQLSVYDKVLQAVEDRYDEEIESIEKTIKGLEKQNEALEKQKDKYDSALSAISKFIETQKDAVQDNIDTIEDENDAIQKEIDGYDRLLNAVTLVINEKRDAIEAEKDAIQERIDALQEENDENQKAYELEKAKYELERLRSQRNKKIYVQDKGYIYDVDHSAIRDAEDNVADLELDATISALEKEQELLDDILEQLDKTEQKWQDIADVFENNKALDTAKDLLGDNFKDIILAGDDVSINDILNAYIGAQGKLEENTLIIEDYEKRMEQLDNIAQKWEEVANIKQEAEDAINAAELLGKEWQEIILSEKTVNYEEFRDKYLEIQSQIEDNTLMIESYNQKIEYYEELKKQWQDITTEYEKQQNKLMADQLLGSDWEKKILDERVNDILIPFKEDYISIQEEITKAAKDSAAAQVKAAEDAVAALEKLRKTKDEQKSLPTVVLGSTEISGKVSNQTFQKYHDGLNKGYVSKYRKLNDNDMLQMFQRFGNGQLKPNEVPAILKQGELVMTPEQQENMAKNMQMLYGGGFIHNNYPQSIANNTSTPVVQNINLTLPNVTNNSGYERLQKELQQMQIDAMQAAHRR